MFMLLVAILVWAYLELTLFLFLADEFGWLFTLMLTIVAGVIGGVIARSQGLRTLLDARRRLDEGEVPLGSMFDAVMIFFAGILLLVPGLISDVIAIVLLIPAGRRAARWAVMRWWQRRVARGDVQIYTAHSSSQERWQPPDVVEGHVYGGNIEEEKREP